MRASTRYVSRFPSFEINWTCPGVTGAPLCGLSWNQFRGMRSTKTKIRMTATSYCHVPRSYDQKNVRERIWPRLAISIRRHSVDDESVAMNKLRDGDIALGRQGGEQIETLKDEADFVAAQFGARGVAQFGEIIPVDQNLAPGSLRQAADHIQQRRLAASRRPHHRDRFARQYLEIHTTQCRAFDLARAVELPQVFCSEYRLHALFSLQNHPFAAVLHLSSH